MDCGINIGKQYLYQGTEYKRYLGDGTSYRCENCNEIYQGSEEKNYDELAKLKQSEENTDATPKTMTPKLRSLIKSIKASRNRCEKLKLTSTLKPILDVVTQWNSTFDMYERVFKLQTALDAVVFFETELHQYIITDEEWERINLLVDVLRPFKDSI
ncbi:hypothetical protein C2G38_2190292 [Gigaspora rosea]|uniref:Uncharacterized protein n=1 Tax=Gigaspora rosea TaxID=44941 RepID=A0A397V340_9GLOM|nr:hypothetical protein C2G38_2190292 [Gigaspora rosea]